MAFPADNYLPAKSIFADTPISGDIRFYNARFEQLQGVRLMLNERRAAVGLSQISAYSQPLSMQAATINTLRTSVEDCFPYYLNDVIHASGSLEGASSYTVWTKSAIFTAVGVGVSNDWTKIPARNSYGLTASGGDLTTSDSFWKEHINELLSVADRLRYAVFTVTWPTLGDRVGAGANPVCSTMKADAITAWNAASFSGSSCGSGSDFGTSIRRYASFTSAPQAFLNSTRGKASVDLSGFAAGTAKLYLKLGRATRSGFTKYFGQTLPNSSAENTFGEWAGAALAAGSVNTTGFVDTTETIPAFDSPIDTCPTPTVLGWHCSDQICIATPTWAYSA